MGRNRMAGKHTSYDKRNMSPAAIKNKRAYDKAYGAQSALIKYRTELNKKNREDGTYGNGDGKDVAHTKDGLKNRRNRRRNRANNGQKKGRSQRAPRRGTRSGS